MAKILLVEDDVDLAESTLACLRDREHHSVDWADTGDKAHELMRFYQYELLILDWHLPQKTGLELLRDYRSRGGTASVLFLTGNTQVSDKTAGLDSGADDYMCKPFDLNELTARVRALIRRGTGAKTTVLTVGDITIDASARSVKKGGEPIHLTPLEFSLLEFLVRHKGNMFSCEALLDRVWDNASDAGPDMVRSTVKRLRSKIQDDGSIIRNMYAKGYKVEAD